MVLNAFNSANEPVHGRLVLIAHILELRASLELHQSLRVLNIPG